MQNKQEIVPILYHYLCDWYLICTVDNYFCTVLVPEFSDDVPVWYRRYFYGFLKRRSEMKKFSIYMDEHLVEFLDDKLSEINREKNEEDAKMTRSQLINGIIKKAIIQNYFGDEQDKYRMALAHNDEVLERLIEHINEQTNAIYQVINLMNGTEIVEEDAYGNE